MNDQREYDEWFRCMVATHCPDLFSEITVKEYRGTEYLEAVVPHPDEKRVVRLSTYGKELTTYIHTHHCHFDQFDDDNHDEEFLETIDWIRAFLSDKLYICTKYDKERIASTMSTHERGRIQPSKQHRLEVLTYSEEETLLPVK
ncbi:MAG TPA: hypothetical protein VIT23_08200 [Terrimicrobiaceae bacterium]